MSVFFDSYLFLYVVITIQPIIYLLIFRKIKLDKIKSNKIIADKIIADKIIADKIIYDKTHYEGFYISNGQTEQIDAVLNGKKVVGNITTKCSIYDDYSHQQVMIELDGLYNQEKMWDMLEHEEYTRDVVLWASKMKQLVMLQITKQLEVAKDLSIQTGDRKSFVDNDMNTFYIKYSKIFRMKEFGCSKLATSFLEKCVEYAKSGVIGSVLVLAHYHPELVCDEIHPIIDHDCKYYQDSDHASYKKSLVYGELYKKYKQYI